MKASQARQATGAGKRAQVNKIGQQHQAHKRAIAKAIKEGKAQGKEDMPDVYKEIKQACDAGERKTTYEASGYHSRDNRYLDGGPDAACAEATAKIIAATLIKDGYKATVRTRYDDTWDPDCGDMSGYTVYIDISWEKAA